MGRRSKSQKQAVEPPKRSLVVMDCAFQLGVSDGEAGKRLVFDYATPTQQGYLTLTAEQTLELVKGACAMLGIPIVTPEDAPTEGPQTPDPTARLVGANGETLIPG